MALRSLVRFIPQSPAFGPDCLKLRSARNRMFAAMLWTAAALALPLSGCIPIEGDVEHFKLIKPAERPLAPGEKIAVTATDPENDDDDAVACVRRRLGLLVAEGSVMEGTAFRSVPGIATAYSGGADPSRMDDIAVDAALRAHMADAGIRFLIEIDVSRSSWAYSFSGGAEWYKQTAISAHVLDVASGGISGPAVASVHGRGGSLLVVGVTPVTEGPACTRVAAFLASSITGTPLSVIAPDLAPLAESERIREAAHLQHVAEARTKFHEDWSLTCRAAMSGKPQAVEGVNALWVGGSYRTGAAPGGVDPARAMAWFTLASDGLRRDDPAAGAPNRFAVVAAEELQKVEAELSAEDRAKAQALADSWRRNSRACEIDETETTLAYLEERIQASDTLDLWWQRDVIGNVGSNSLRFLGICRRAMRGETTPRMYVGNQHEHGSQPFQLDRTEAYKWFLLAREAGHERADARLERLRADMSAAEIGEADRRAADWWPDPSQCIGMLESAGAS